MLFTPESDLLWDTWLVERDGVFHLFYIRARPGEERAASGAPEPTIGFGWDAINLATSTDLLHWTDQGSVIHKSPDALWLGTGMVHQVEGGYVVNFSEERPRGHQVICFAASTDLITWQRFPAERDLRADGTIYQSEPERSADPLPRWDSLGVVAPGADRSHFLGMLTAEAVDATAPGASAVLGCVTSGDGIDWAVAPPLTRPGMFPSYEVPQHVQFGGRHYVLFSTNTTAGARFVAGDPHPQGGTYYVVSDAIDGPYELPPCHPMLQGHRSAGREFGTYVGRPFLKSDGEQLYYHHWTAAVPDGWWGPPKLLVERAPYVLGLDYWPGTEGLKVTADVQLFRPDRFVPLARAGALPVVNWQAVEGGLRVTDGGGAHAARWDVGPGCAGHVVEAEITVDSGRALGFWFGYEHSDDMLGVCFDVQNRCVELGTVTYFRDGSSVTIAPEETAAVEVAYGRAVRVRLLARHQFVEIYADDRLVKSFVGRSPLDLDRLGFYAERAVGAFSGICHWPMSV